MDKSKVRSGYWKNNHEFGFGYINYKVTAGHLDENASKKLEMQI